MAGAGYKLFNTGDVLTAAQVNTYLMEQTVMVFADAAARTTALTGVVSEGMLSYLKDTNAVEVYNGSAWVSSDDPNAIQNTIVDAKGDLITATAADTPARLAVGSNDTFLTADSAQATGLKWSGTWTDWTPTWTNLTVGNGTYNLKRYNKIGKIVYIKLDFVFGSTTSITGSDIRFSLPFTGANNGGMYSGNGFLLDSGTELYDAHLELTNSDAYIRLRQANLTNNWVNGTRVVTATSPFTWTTNDRISINGWYEVA